jgi:hypothetical protein
MPRHGFGRCDGQHENGRFSGLGAATQTAYQQRGDDSCTNSLLYDLLQPRAPQAVGNQAQLALKEFDPCEHTAIVAEAVFVERGVNLFGQPKWVVADIFDTGVRVPTWW